MPKVMKAYVINDSQALLNPRLTYANADASYINNLFSSIPLLKPPLYAFTL